MIYITSSLASSRLSTFDFSLTPLETLVEVASCPLPMNMFTVGEIRKLKFTVGQNLQIDSFIPK